MISHYVALDHQDVTFSLKNELTDVAYIDERVDKPRREKLISTGLGMI